MAGFKRRTLEELLSVDIRKLTKAELQGYKKVARDEVARNVKRWEGREYKSPAYYALKKATGDTLKISFKGKDTLQQQKKELAKAIHFLSDQSRTVKGWNEIKKENITKINEHFAKDKKEVFNTVNYDRLYEAYNKAKQIDRNIESQEFKYAVMESLIDRITDETIDVDQVALEMAEEAKKIYKQREKERKRNDRNRSKRYKKRK